jgi:hypothetical protein
MSAVAMQLPDRSAGRRMLLLLSVALAMPFIVAAALIFSGWRPAAVPHYGELLAPAAPLALEDLNILAGPQQSMLTGRWLLVAVEPQSCAADCLHRLEALRRLHVALYKAMPRVRRVLLVPALSLTPPPDLTVAGSASWPAFDRAGIYLVDPRGQVVLRYDAAATDYKAMLKDIERLLRYSWTG